MKIFIGFSRWLRDFSINIAVYPFFFLTIYIQAASQLRWDLLWLSTNAALFCLLSWIAGVFLTWRLGEYAWERYISQRNWKGWRIYAFIVGGCSLAAAFTSMVAQIEMVYAPKVYIALSLTFMIVNAVVFNVSSNLDKTSNQGKDSK